MKIFEISAVIRSLMESLSSYEEPADEKAKAELEEAQKQAMGLLDEATGDLKTKVKAMTAYALELRTERESREARIDAIKRNILHPMELQNLRDQKKEQWLLETVQGALTSVSYTDPLKFEEFTVALQKMPLTAVIENPSSIPKDYLRVIPAVAESTAPDKKKILADLKDGVVIAGAKLSGISYKLVIK